MHWVRLCALPVFLLVFLGALMWWSLAFIGVTPRALGPYLERRASGHNPVITESGKWLNTVLTRMDRGDERPVILPPLRVGAKTTGEKLDTTQGNLILAASAEDLLRAVSQAKAGDTILLLPGRYTLRGRSPVINQPGLSHAGITLKAKELGTVMLELDLVEGFIVSAPYWTFENLVIRGICEVHDRCEHAFHVVGDARNFTARNNIITDFNAHFKINGFQGKYPDGGTIEDNTLSNNAVRDTSRPVTVIDLVGASGWVVRRNVISDFIKGQSNRISYGAFAKGGGRGNLFEQNIVLCEQKLRGKRGQRVGLSLGGGGTGPQYCRDGRCITEQDGSTLRSNLIAFCSDDGIYINRSATSKVLQNTLMDTGGIVVRFPESTADVTGNLVDGTIRSRNDGLIRQEGNQTTPLPLLYAGIHPVRDLFLDAPNGDFRWQKEAPRKTWSLPTSPDLCENGTDNSDVVGAFRNFSACLEIF